MRNNHRRATALARAAACALLLLGISTPAAAQFGGLKKKLKSAAGQEAATEAQKAAGVSEAPAATAPTPAAQNAAIGGTVVLTPDVVDRLVTGLKAGDSVRRAASKEDTPYGRYHQALAAYETAKPKCEEARATFPNRMAADEKMMDKYNDLVNKMVEAQSKGDTKAAMAYNDQAMAMQDPSCVVKEPAQPDDYYGPSAASMPRPRSRPPRHRAFAGRVAMGLERDRMHPTERPRTRRRVAHGEVRRVRARPASSSHCWASRSSPRRPREKRRPRPARPGSPFRHPAVSPAASAMSNCMAQNVHEAPEGDRGAGRARPGRAEEQRHGDHDGHRRYPAAAADGRLHRRSVAHEGAPPGSDRAGRRGSRRRCARGRAPGCTDPPRPRTASRCGTAAGGSLSGVGRRRPRAGTARRRWRSGSRGGPGRTVSSGASSCSAARVRRGAPGS